MAKNIWRRIRPYAIKLGSKVAEVALMTAIVILFIYLLFIADDGYRPPMPEQAQIQAIDGNYYYSADDYDQYLQERQAYIDAEAEVNGNAAGN